MATMFACKKLSTYAALAMAVLRGIVLLAIGTLGCNSQGPIEELPDLFAQIRLDARRLQDWADVQWFKPDPYLWYTVEAVNHRAQGYLYIHLGPQETIGSVTGPRTSIRASEACPADLATLERAWLFNHGPPSLTEYNDFYDKTSSSACASLLYKEPPEDLEFLTAVYNSDLDKLHQFRPAIKDDEVLYQLRRELFPQPSYIRQELTKLKLLIAEGVSTVFDSDRRKVGAVCKDGTASTDDKGCSNHGGVAFWRHSK